VDAIFYIVAIFFAMLVNFSFVSEFGLPLQAIGNSTILAPNSSTSLTLTFFPVK